MNIIFKNITLARESRGYTQSDMAEGVQGLTQGNLSRMEKGLLPISDEIIRKISEFLNYPISFFQKECNIATGSSMFYRKRISMPRKKLSKIEAQINITSRIIDDLLESINIPEFNIPHVDVTDKMTPENIAYRVRDYLGIPSGPVENMVSILEKHGVIVIFYDVDYDKFDGVTKFTNKSQPVIWVNENMPNDRKRFTLAHEMGHLVMHLRNQDLDLDDNEMEKQANRFAAEFMLPFIECKKDFFNLKFNDLSSLKYYWKMSKAAILYRAKEIGSINEQTYTYYNICLGRNGEKKNEREIIDIDRPTILPKMINLHIDQLGYEKSELADMLGLSIDDLNKLYLNLEVRPKFKLVL